MNKLKEILEAGLKNVELSSDNKIKQLEKAKLTMMRLENEIIRLSYQYDTEKEGTSSKKSKEELLKIDYSVFDLGTPTFEKSLEQADQLIEEYKHLL